MTAINAVRTKDEVLIFTDGAEYDRECVITQFRSKLFVSPHLPLVMSSRGPVGAIETLAAELERRATSFEDVLRWLRSPMARAMAESIRSRAAIDPVYGVHIVVAGIEQGAPALYSLEPYRSLDLEPQRVVLAPWHDGLPTVVVDGSERRLIRGMVGLMEYQRQHCLLDGNSVVGGFIEMTSIARDRITRRIVHRWPDRVGEKISLEHRAAA